MNRSPSTTGRTVRDSTRRGVLSIAMWVFGLSVSMLLVGLWGRSVVVDRQTVADATRVVVDADLARERIRGWITGAVTASQDLDSGQVNEAVDAVSDRPEVAAAIDDAVEAFVGALFATGDERVVIDAERLVAPIVPVVVEQLERQQLPVDAEALAAALNDASAIELGTDGLAGVAAAVQDARALVTRVVVLALLVMVASGGLAVALAEERFAMVRTLSIRVLLSALSFAVLFRLGAWALDPHGGRSPIASGGSVVLGSNGHVFLAMAALAALIGTIGAALAWRRRRPLPFVPIESEADDTAELVPA
ncbi:MAG: hypothetical protein R2823_01955 [Acidimicrobiia bacterium]